MWSGCTSGALIGSGKSELRAPMMIRVSSELANAG
jgi:hypothetical protein